MTWMQKQRRLVQRFQHEGLTMKPECPVPAQILKAAAKAPGCRIEELVYLFPDVTWIQVVHEVNRLNRNDQFTPDVRRPRPLYRQGRAMLSY